MRKISPQPSATNQLKPEASIDGIDHAAERLGVSTADKFIEGEMRAFAEKSLGTVPLLHLPPPIPTFDSTGALQWQRFKSEFQILMLYFKVDLHVAAFEDNDDNTSGLTVSNLLCLKLTQAFMGQSQILAILGRENPTRNGVIMWHNLENYFERNIIQNYLRLENLQEPEIGTPESFLLGAELAMEEVNRSNMTMEQFIIAKFFHQLQTLNNPVYSAFVNQYEEGKVDFPAMREALLMIYSCDSTFVTTPSKTLSESAPAAREGIIRCTRCNGRHYTSRCQRSKNHVCSRCNLPGHFTVCCRTKYPKNKPSSA